MCVKWALCWLVIELRVGLTGMSSVDLALGYFLLHLLSLPVRPFHLASPSHRSCSGAPRPDGRGTRQRAPSELPWAWARQARQAAITERETRPSADELIPQGPKVGYGPDVD